MVLQNLLLINAGVSSPLFQQDGVFPVNLSSQKILKFIDYMKLRGSIATLGNDAIGVAVDGSLRNYYRCLYSMV